MPSAEVKGHKLLHLTGAINKQMMSHAQACKVGKARVEFTIQTPREQLRRQPGAEFPEGRGAVNDNQLGLPNELSCSAPPAWPAGGRSGDLGTTEHHLGDVSRRLPCHYCLTITQYSCHSKLIRPSIIRRGPFDCSKREKINAYRDAFPSSGFTNEAVFSNVTQALTEDLGGGDITASLIDADALASATVITRQAEFLAAPVGERNPAAD